MMKTAFILPLFIAVLMFVNNTAQADLKPAPVVSFCETYEECNPWPDGTGEDVYWPPFK